MRIVTRFTWAFLIAALILSAFAPAVIAQTPVPQQIPGSEYPIDEPFLSYYRAMPDPYVMLGLPITEAYEEAEYGYMVQYFQRGRLEISVNAAGERSVRMSKIGELTYVAGGETAPVRNSGPTCRSFSTGYNVCYGFLQFYDAYQGDTYFGNPISGVELEDGRMVQYFENVRLEWRGEVINGRHVGLSDMGRRHYDMLYRALPRPRSNNNPAVIGNPATSGQTTPTLTVRTFVKHSLLPANNQQTLYIVVQDQSNQPVAGAAVSVVVSLPGNLGEQTYRPNATNADGISVFTFQIGDVPVKEMVNISVTARHSDYSAEQRATTWFRIWW